MKSKGYDSITSWIAAFACGVIGFLIVIPMRLAGFFFVIIIDQYNVDREKATLPIVVFGMLRSLTGPFIGYLGQTIGLRATTTLGCGLASIGIGVCFFADDITAVIIGLGFIYGLGLGLGVSLVPEILKQHFSKSINTPFGIYASGGCVGAIVMPKVLQVLNHEYGYSGMLLILSAIVLNSVPAALILKNPKNNIKLTKSEITSNSIDVKDKQKTNAPSNNDKAEKLTVENNIVSIRKSNGLSTALDNKTMSIGERNIITYDNPTFELKNVPSDINGDASVHYISVNNENFYNDHNFELDGVSSDIKKDVSTHLYSTNLICKKNKDSDDNPSVELKDVPSDIKEDASMLRFSSHLICESNKNSYDNPSVELKVVPSDIIGDVSMHLFSNNIICENKKNSYDNSSVELKVVPKEDASMQIIKVAYQDNNETKKPKNVKNHANENSKEETRMNAINAKSERASHTKSKKLQSLQLFINPTFYLTMIVQSCHGFVTTLTWTIIVDLGRDRGHSTERSVYFLMFFPIAEMIGSLGLNWIINHGFMSQTLYCMSCYLILGFIEVCLVWVHDFISMMTLILIFGVFSGSLGTTFPGMVYEFFDEDEHSMALTSRFVLYSVLCLTKSPIIGYFRGKLGSYDGVLYIITLSCVSCAILVTFTPIVASWRRRKISKKCKHGS